MATTNRSDRQLMRQRGAGSRKVDSINFGLNFGPTSSRDDRQLMRQRGAGNRDIGNVDFGFAFPTPTQSRRSSRTPQHTRKNSSRSSKTPASTTRRESLRTRQDSANATQTRTASPSHQNLTEALPSANVAERPNSGKRRRLNTNVPREATNSIVINVPPPRDYVRNHRDSSVVADAREGFVEEDYGNAATRSSSPLFFPDEDKENEATRSPNTKSRRSQVTSHSMALGTTLLPQSNKPVRSDSIVLSIETEELFPTSSAPASDMSEILAPLSSQPIQHTSTLEDINRQSQSGSNIDRQTKKRKKRKSVVLGRKKRRSSEHVNQSGWPAEKTGAPISEDDGDVEEDINEQRTENISPDAETENQSQASINSRVPLWRKLINRKASARRNRLSMSASPAQQDRGDEEGDETYIDEDGTPDPVTPAPRKKRLPIPSGDHEPDVKRIKKRGIRGNQNSFPITTHRITNTRALPTILEEYEPIGDSDAEVEELPAAFSNRSQPNAVDVLAQICRETVQSAIGQLEAGASGTSSRAGIKNKRTALEAFSENLEQRLFDMSEAVEHRMTLEARLRKSKRERAELQARWMEVRRQRDDLALQADIIRRQNWENDEQGKQQWQISGLAHNIEMEVERQDIDDYENTEFLLRQTSDYVTSSAGQGGILARAKRFNGQLEKLAALLEGR